MREEVKIFHAERNSSWRMIVERAVRREGGHEVVFATDNFNEAISFVKSVGARDWVNVAVIGGSFSGIGDGSLIAASVREHLTGVPIVALSVDKQTWGDVYVDKREFDSGNFANLITNLITSR